MKQLFALIITCVLCAGFVVAGDYFPVKLTVAASGTTASADVDLSQTFGDKALFVERVSATVTSGNGTGVVTFASVDHGVATTVSTSGSLVSGDLYVGYPARTVTTSTVVQNAVVTNDVPIIVTTTNTVSASQPYLLKTVRVSVTQAAVSGSTVYNAVIYVK
jgi:hypothetical protein